MGREPYETFAEKAASLLHSLARNRALVEGNRRLAWAATRVYCLLDDRDLKLAVDDAEPMVVGAATGALDVEALAVRIGEHLRPV